MNSDRLRRSSDNDDLTRQLQSFRPAKANIDSAVLFYRAGFQAAQVRPASGRIPTWRAIAAGLVAVMLAAPAGFLVGQASLKAPRVAAERPRTEDVQILTHPRSRPSPAPKVEPPREPPDTPASSEPSFFASYAPMLVSLWGQPSAQTADSNPDRPQASLAAYHSLVSSPSRNLQQWPEYFAHSDALLHADPSITTVRSDVMRSSTMVVGDAQQMATMMEAIR